MPHRNFRSSRPIRAGSPRLRTWAQNSGVETLAAGTGSNRDLLAAYNEDAGTVVRLLLKICVENWAALPLSKHTR